MSKVFDKNAVPPPRKKGKFKLFDKSLITLQDKNGKLNLFALMLPVFLQCIINNMLGSINTAILSNYDSTIITAMNASNRIITTTLYFCVLGSAGLSIILAHALGRDDKEVINNIPLTAIVCNVVLGVVVCLIALALQEPLLSMMNLTGEIMANAKIYFSLRQIAVLISVVSSCFSAMLSAYGKVTSSVIIGIGTCILSALVMWAFVYTPLGSFMPMIYNCAINSIFVTAVGLIAYCCVIFKNKLKIGRKFKFAYVKRLFRIGVPSSITGFSYSMSMLLTTSIISMLDVTFINVKVYCDTIFGFVSYLGYSFANAGGIMAGRLVGAGQYDKTKRLYRQNFVIVLMANFVFALIVFLFREPLYMIFDRNPSHLALIFPVFLLDILVELGRGTNHANQFMLNAVGDVTYCTIVSIISCWISGVLLSYVFAIVCGWGLVGCWIAFIMDEWTRGILYIIRWHSGKWEHKTV